MQLTEKTLSSKPTGWPVGYYMDAKGNQPASSEFVSGTYYQATTVTDGTGYKNLYVAGVDGIDQGSSESASDYDVSDFCIVIKKRAFGMSPPKYVAIYKDRPQKVETAYEIAAKLVV